MPSSCESLCHAANSAKQKSWRTSVCSCSNCDSYGCFEVRHQATKMCVCETCDSPKSCLLIQNQETSTDENVILQQIFSASETQCDIEKICNAYENECKENCKIDQNNAVCKDVLINKQSEKISHENKEQYPCFSCQKYPAADNNTKLSSPQESYLEYGDKNDPAKEVAESPKVKQTKFIDHSVKNADDSLKNDNVSLAEINKNQPRKDRKLLYPTDSRILIKKRSRKSKENSENEIEKPVTCPMAGKKCDKNCSEPESEDPSLRQKPITCPGSQKCNRSFNESRGKYLSMRQKQKCDKDFKEYKSEDPLLCQKPVTCLMATQKCNKDFNESKDPPSYQKPTASPIALKKCNNCAESKSQEPVCGVVKSKLRRTELCSCVDCNSLNCFELRYRAAVVCVCKTCENFKSCSLYKRPSTAAGSTTPLTQIFSASETQLGIPCCNVPALDKYCDIEHLDLISEKEVPIACQTKEVNDLPMPCCDVPPYEQRCDIEHVDLISEKEIPMVCQINESDDHPAEPMCAQSLDNKISGKINEQDKVCKTCHMKFYNFDGKTTERNKNYEAKKKEEVRSNENRIDQIDKSLKPEECHDICKEYIIWKEKREQAKRKKRKVDVVDLLNLNNAETETKSKEQNNKISKTTSNKNNLKPKDASLEQTCKEQSKQISISSIATKHDKGLSEEKTEINSLDQKAPPGKSKTCTTDSFGCCDENSTICKYECHKCHTLAAKSSCGNRSPFHSQPVKKYIKYCPAFCPTCHRLYIEEHNEESKRAKVSLKPCPNCRKIIPKTKDTTENYKNLPTLNKYELKQKNCKSDRKNISPEDLMFTDVSGGTEPITVQTACKTICFEHENEESIYRQKAYPIRKCKISSFESFSSEETNECVGKCKISYTEKYKEDVDQNKYKKNGVHSASQYHSTSNKDDRLGCCQSLHTDKKNITVRHFKPYNSKINKSQDGMINFIKECVHREIEDICKSLAWPTNKIDENGHNANCCSCSTGQSPINDKPFDPNVDQKPLGTNVAQRNGPAFYEKIKDVIYKEIKDIKESISKRYETTNKVCEDFKARNLNKIEERGTAKVEGPSTTSACSTIKDLTTKAEFSNKLPKDQTTTKDERFTMSLPRWPTEQKKFGSLLIDPKSLTLQTNTCEIKLSVPTSLNYIKNKDHNKINSNSECWAKDKATTRTKEYASSAYCTNKISSKKCGTADELTAQILSVPLKEYRESTFRPDVKPMRSIELLKMLRDIYKACSCKVCQCIGSGLTKVKNEKCSCKPCDCSECRARNNNCVTGANKKTDLSECTCKPCDCIECKADYSLKSCNCKHCECIDCKSMCIGMKQNKRKYETSFIVAPVRERLQRPYCQCSPCGCFDCAHPFGTVPPTHTSQETGTDERRHMNCNCDSCANNDCEREGADTCTCETQSKIVKKPVTNTKTDYDIHYFINNKTNFRSLTKRDPVTIYTSLTHHLFHPHKTRHEDVCKNWKNVANLDYSGYDCSKTVSETMLSHEYWTLRANTAIASDCDCKPCECKKCKKHYLEGHMSHFPYNRDRFVCEICDCIKSATSSLTFDMKKGYSKKLNLSYSTQNCNCQPCKCKDCRKYMFIPIQDNIRQYEALRDGTTQTTLENDTARNNFQNLIKISEPERFIDIVLSDKETRNHDIVNNDPSSTRTQVSFSDSEHLKLYCANMANNEFNFYCNKNQLKDDSSNSNTNKMQHESSLHHNKLQSYNDKIILGTKIHHSQISDHLMTESVVSSNGSSSKHTYINKQSNRQDLTTDSSCNSSGHDDSEYLIRLPTSTVETCIKDVMSLQTYNKPEKDNLEATLHTLNHNMDESIFDLQFFDNNDTLQHNDTMDGKCNNWKTDKSYNRHKYDNKIPKLKCQCDCAACRCDDTCLSAVSVQKNENSQTTKSMLCSEEEIFKASLLKKLNVTFSNNDRIVRWTDVPVRNIKHETKNSATKTDIPTINYDSVRRTIKEAKQFSLDLLSILQKYEKANRDFDSKTKRFKSIHESVIGEDDTQKQHIEQSNDYQVAYIKTISKYPSIPDTEKDIIYNSNKTDFRKGNFERNKPSYPFEKYNETSSKCEYPYDCQPATKKSDIDVKELERTEKMTCNPTLNSTQMNNKHNIEKEADIKKDNSDPTKSPEIKNQYEQVKSNTKAKMITSSTNTTAKLEEKVNLENLKNEYKEYSEHLDKVIDKCRRNQWGIKKIFLISDSHRSSENTTTWKNSGMSSRRSSSKEAFVDKDCNEFNTVFTCGSQRNDESHVKENLPKKPKILSTQQLDSLKQIVLPETKGANIAERSEAKHQTQMPNTTRDVESQARLCRIYESAPSMALRKLELKSGGTKSTADTSAINYTVCKNSYDSMKVTFQTVRKVSDHSILLKWKIPDVTTNIKGYEILVDGRAIQRVLSPSKNMAVLTCLPHAYKVKVTVRTITETPDGHAPCATVSVCTRS